MYGTTRGQAAKHYWEMFHEECVVVLSDEEFEAELGLY